MAAYSKALVRVGRLQGWKPTISRIHQALELLSPSTTYPPFATVEGGKLEWNISDSSRPFPLKFCDPNVMVLDPLVANIWAGTDQYGTFFDNNWGPS